MRTRNTVLMSMLALAVLHCGEDAAELPGGAVSVTWLVGTTGCTEAEVTTIAAYLSGPELEGTGIFTFPCDAGVGTITDLPPGHDYSLSLRGRDVVGDDRFGGAATGITVRSEGTASVPTVRMSALPADLHVSWYFENGRFCPFNNVEIVEATLFEDEYEMHRVSAACSDGELVFADIQADTYIIDVVGRDPAGQVHFNGQDNVIVKRGDYMDIEIRLAEAGVDGGGSTTVPVE